MPDATIIYTLTDESPALATYSLLPVVQAYAAQVGVWVTTRDISLSGRILAAFPEYLTPEQRVNDDLAYLGELVNEPTANIIKLPNISAPMPQVMAAVAELQAQGYAVPNVPESPSTDEARDILARYRKVSGSAVNPVLRQGNSDRRAAPSVKRYAQAHPHQMGAWSPDSRTTVVHMSSGDFRSNERSITMSDSDTLQIDFVDATGVARPLRAPLAVEAGEVVDATVMSVAALDKFLAEQIARAAADDVLFSVHLKATMMKVSDPIMFGHVVRAFFPVTFATYGAEIAAAGLTPNNGLGSLFAALPSLAHGADIEASLRAEMAAGPSLAMVDSSKGITNLHAPNDVIVDASMPAMIRTSGHMWGPDGEEHDTLAVIPDASYAGIYQVTIEDCKRHGAFDPATMGSVANVGLMAQAAEEYGSHDKTFEMTEAGVVRVSDSAGDDIFTFTVEPGDIFRMCQTKDVPIRDWVKLAVARTRATGDPAIFWLDETRAHDAQLIAKVTTYLAEHDLTGLDISISAPEAAIARSLERSRAGHNTISVTGNVLRDYLTDLFPIMELGTSAKMLSIVPLINGGGLFETGAGGSAPRQVQQLVEKNYLRWDSLGEFLALAVSFEHFAQATGNARARVLGDALDRATGRLLEEDRSPGRAIGTIDNRGSHFYLSLYWAQELARQNDDADVAALFAPIAQQLSEAEDTIVAELIAAQGAPVDIGGYFHPRPELAAFVMRPSTTWNGILATLS